MQDTDRCFRMKADFEKDRCIWGKTTWDESAAPHWSAINAMAGTMRASVTVAREDDKNLTTPYQGPTVPLHPSLHRRHLWIHQVVISQQPQHHCTALMQEPQYCCKPQGHPCARSIILTYLKKSESSSTVGVKGHITYELKNYLMLDPICTKTMLIKTFGSENCSSQLCEVVELEVSLRVGGSLNMSFLSVPLICEPISGQSISYAVSTHEELASLEFSDYTQGDSSFKYTSWLV